ncbi:alpha-amylase 3, chloroplastic-like [Ipomoea triloba]|uniref:alpha-amylase 3, chloroplastic-like n=1 Tax=Ipomoea triloba TaxID=35885 RepID=UPI00125D5AB6|nr:alpha-amylase 3, chloroplastic-like [Ipomoea triloba]
MRSYARALTGSLINLELQEKAELLSSLGFTVVWLPPPTESVSPEGYMPKDLYNLNSRYGTIDELKVIVKRFHEVGIQVLGDVVLNHRCASFRNHNGVWNIFGGRLVCIYALVSPIFINYKQMFNCQSRHMTRIIICEKLIEMEVECMIDNALHLAKTSNPEL